MHWLRLSVDYDHHPQVVDAGWHGAQLFLLLLRLSRRFRLDGRLPPKYASPEFIRKFWGCPSDFPLEEAMRDVTRVTLVRFEGSELVIDGWDRWNKTDDSTERVRRFRERNALQKRDVTQRRGEESRGEEKDQRLPELPLGAPAAPRPKKPRRSKLALPTEASSPDDPAASSASRPPTEQQAYVTEVYRYWEDRLGKPRLEKVPPEVWGVLGKCFKAGLTLELAREAVDGVLVDAERWPERAVQNSIAQIFGSVSRAQNFADLARKGPPKPAIDIEKIRRGNQRAEDQGWESVEKRPVDRTKVIA